MPTILSHPAVPLALATGLGRRVVSTHLLVAGVVASVLPDVDVIGFRLGIPYGHPLGHRGLTHSLGFALALAVLAALCAPRLRTSRRAAFLVILAAAASHGLLDMLTEGGRGIALFWPLTAERFVFPVRVLDASPLSLSRFLGPPGLRVLGTELLWLWLPATVGALGAFLGRRRCR